MWKHLKDLWPRPGEPETKPITTDTVSIPTSADVFTPKPKLNKRTLSIIMNDGAFVGATYSSVDDLVSSVEYFKDFIHWWFDKTSPFYLLKIRNNEDGKMWRLIVRTNVRTFSLEDTCE